MATLLDRAMGCPVGVVCLVATNAISHTLAKVVNWRRRIRLGVLVDVSLDCGDSECGLDRALSKFGRAQGQELFLWSEKLATHVAMMRGSVVLGHVVGKVECAGSPIEAELVAEFAVAEPVKAHVHGFGLLGLDGVASKLNLHRMKTMKTPRRATQPEVWQSIRSRQRKLLKMHWQRRISRSKSSR